MGRKSKLTEKQWESIGKRLLDGESARGLAAEFGVAESAIRKRFGARTKEIKSVANQLVAAETAFAALPISAQISARTLADRLKAIGDHMLGSAEFSASTSHRVSGIANSMIGRIDDVDPLSEDSLKALKGIAALTQLANSAAEIPVALLKANKDTVGQEQPPSPVQIVIGVKDASKHDPES